jgi:hypothetical protein
MATGAYLDARTQTETMDKDLISIGRHKVAPNARAQALKGVLEFTGAYLSFKLYKETK